MPSAESGGVSNMWYSFESGPVHFVSLLTETDLGEGLLGPIEKAKGNVNGPFGKPNQQVDWLKADLAAVDRQKTPWVVVGLHRPWVRFAIPRPPAFAPPGRVHDAEETSSEADHRQYASRSTPRSKFRRCTPPGNKLSRRSCTITTSTCT